jgi:hypothetical protein
LHYVLGSIQEAALEAHHAPGSAVRGRRRAKRARPKPKAKRPAIAKPVPPPLAEAAPGAVVHVLRPMIGPSVAGVGGTWACNLCNVTATGPTRWGPFAKALCHADPRAVQATREVRVHELGRVAGGWACSRCRLAVPSHRRAAAARAKCPVPVVLLLGHDPCALSCRQIQRNFAALALWKAPTAVGPAPPSLVVGPVVAPFAWFGGPTGLSPAGGALHVFYAAVQPLRVRALGWLPVRVPEFPRLPLRASLGPCWLAFLTPPWTVHPQLG